MLETMKPIVGLFEILPSNDVIFWTMRKVFIAFKQESKAEKALEALKEIQSEHACVIRDGEKISSLPAKELVPGDIVELVVGDRVPANMRVLSLISSTLRVEQGSLTGESEAVSKTVKLVVEDIDI